MLTADDERQLLRVAREAIEAHANDAPAPRMDPGLGGQQLGVFVTLYKRHDGKLRGCVGQVRPSQPLARLLPRIAISAANRDPRFAPLASGELEEVRIELSLLHTVTVLDDPIAQLEIGRHGVMIRSGESSGVYLPKVARRMGWTAERLLREVSKKAGLDECAWSEAEVRSFEATVFGEPV